MTEGTRAFIMGSALYAIENMERPVSLSNMIGTKKDSE